jgi:hypothetical protein
MIDRSIGRLEKLLAIALSVAALTLMVVRAQHAGGLWRDECGLVQLSQMPSLADIFRDFPHEAFPPVFATLIRAWTFVFGTSDVVFRAFGLAVGVLVIAVLWFNCRAFRSGVPLLSLVLVGLNSTFLIWGTSIRGYGLASAAIALVFGLLARLILKPSPSLFLATAIACVLSVQCLLHNTVLVFGLISSAVIVLLIRRSFKAALAVFGIGVLTFLSFVPYAGSYLAARRQWDVTVRVPFSWEWARQNFGAAFGAPAPWISLFWLGCFALLIGGVIWRLVLLRREESRERDVLLFAVGGSLGSIGAYLLFLDLVNYFPQPWYFFTLIAIVATAMDLFAASLSHAVAVRVGRILACLTLVVGLPFAAVPKLEVRQTNVDIIAKFLEERSAPSDLIVVSPWQYGIPFNWYYKGRAPWVTLPELTEHRMHRYDLIKAKMVLSDPNVNVREAIRSTLQSGHRVWFVGEVRVPMPNVPPMAIAPAPDPTFGWDSAAYCMAWSEQLGLFLRQHIATAETLPKSTDTVVSDLEDAPLIVARGWRD